MVSDGAVFAAASLYLVAAELHVVFVWLRADVPDVWQVRWPIVLDRGSGL